MLLFAGFESAVDKVTLVGLLIPVPFTILHSTFTTIVTVACAPFASEPRFAITLAPPLQVPTLGVHETKVMLAGRLSATTTLLALFGPLLVTVIR